MLKVKNFPSLAMEIAKKFFLLTMGKFVCALLLAVLSAYIIGWVIVIASLVYM